MNAPEAPSVAVAPSEAKPVQAEFRCRLSPKKVFCGFVAVILGLLVLGTLAMEMKRRTGAYGRVVRLFDLDSENCFPAWYSSLALAVAGGVSAVVALRERQHRGRMPWHWMGLSAGFLFLSADETAMVHEYLMSGDALGIKGEGLLFRKWVIPAIAAVALFGISYLRFVWRLPARVRWLAILAAGLFCGGAIVCEMLSGPILTGDPVQNRLKTAYLVEVVAEEGLEMFGVAVWIYAQLLYLADRSTGPTRFVLETKAA